MQESVLPGSGTSLAAAAGKSISWVPCSTGLTSLCFAAAANTSIGVGSNTVHSTSSTVCVSVSVVVDPPPTLNFATPTGLVGTIGMETHIGVHSADGNPLD